MNGGRPSRSCGQSTSGEGRCEWVAGQLARAESEGSPRARPISADDSVLARSLSSYVGAFAPAPDWDEIPWWPPDVFTVANGEQIFLAAVSDAQWRTFCDVLGFADLKDDPRYATNNDRVRMRPMLLATLRERLASWRADGLATLFEEAGLPFAPIRRPEDLYDDVHLNATGGLANVRIADGDKAGETVRTTLLPIALDAARLGVRLDPPHKGEHTRALLAELGYDDAAIKGLYAERAVA